MRTTLTLEEDLAGRLKERAQQLGISFKEMAHRALRSGLDHSGRDRSGLNEGSVEPSGRPKTIPHSFGFKPEVDLNKMNRLADDLEVEAMMESLHRQES